MPDTFYMYMAIYALLAIAAFIYQEKNFFEKEEKVTKKE